MITLRLANYNARNIEALYDAIDNAIVMTCAEAPDDTDCEACPLHVVCKDLNLVLSYLDNYIDPKEGDNNV